MTLLQVPGIATATSKLAAFEPIWLRAARALNVLLAAGFGYFAFTLFDSDPVYYFRKWHEDELPFWLWVALAVRLVPAMPWRSILRMPAQRLPLAALLLSLPIFALHQMVTYKLPCGAEGVVDARHSYSNRTQREMENDSSDFQPVYPSLRFLHKVIDAIPETDGIAYAGDQRGHIMGFHLYPRRLYMVPELQIELLKGAQRGWAWAPLSDPLFPIEDVVAGPAETFPQSEPITELQESMRKMIREKDIRWFMYYDSLYPENCFFCPVPEEWRKP